MTGAGYIVLCTDIKVGWSVDIEVIEMSLSRLVIAYSFTFCSTSFNIISCIVKIVFLPDFTTAKKNEVAFNSTQFFGQLIWLVL